jgi:penicillin-binding protein 1A
MEGALAKSINTIAVDVLMRAGISNVVDLAKRMGIDSDLPEYPSLALGTASVSLQEMVCTYSELVNGGLKITPYYLKAVESNTGQVLEEFKNVQSGEQVAQTENCRIITQMLKSVVNEGTGSSIRTEWGIDSEFAGKTGTTQDQADGWFIGMTPTLVAGAWVGGEDPSIHFRTLGEGAGGHTALPIVGQFYSRILHQSKFQNMKSAIFESPAEESLALMSIPPYREILPVGARGFLQNLFGKKDVQQKSDLKMQEKSNSEPANEEATPEPKPDKKPFWQSMKDIFKKKSK